MAENAQLKGWDSLFKRSAHDVDFMAVRSMTRERELTTNTMSASPAVEQHLGSPDVAVEQTSNTTATGQGDRRRREKFALDLSLPERRLRGEVVMSTAVVAVSAAQTSS